MVIVFYYHTGRGVEYHKEFEDVYEARKFKDKMKHVGYYLVSFIADSEYEFNVMERIYE